ncbi:MAG: YdeI/OmpD-associated family protein [Acidobacteriia bacterium]|nr:YdeI/OmpD-associated family protein [Terriglobia bacterium]
MTKPTASKSFKATLELLRSGLGWVIARVPFDVAKTWGTRRPKVKGEINGFPFRTTLFPKRTGGHFVLVNKRMQRESGTVPGSVAQFRLELDTEERTVIAPAELKRAMAGDRALERWYDTLNYSTRKYIAEWITEVKGAEARVRRAEQLAERLLSTMEAEQELPPLLRLAFGRTRHALEGWQRMSPAQRRAQLLAIFYYRNPEARERRVAKVVEAAAEYAQKKAGG